MSTFARAVAQIKLGIGPLLLSGPWASIQESRLKQIVGQNLERLKLVSSRTQLRLSLRDFVKDARPEHQSKMNRILDDAKSAISGLIDISVLSLDGQVVAGTNRADIGSKHPDKEFFVRGKRENCSDILKSALPGQVT